MQTRFRKKKISDRTPLKLNFPRASSPAGLKKIFLYGFLILLLLFLLKSCGAATGNLVEKAIFSLGSDLQTDARGNTNLLLIGVGGAQHEGSDLTDTLIIASINHEKQTVTMVSIPRDLHVKNPLNVTRINEIYFYAKSKFDSETERIKPLSDAVSAFAGIPVHYYIKVDFAALQGTIDALDGIEVQVDEAIYDPYYPKDGTIGYEPFSLPQGLIEMDGKTALKYVRSRKTTSDFDRSLRQQKVIFAIKDKAKELRILTSAGRLKDLYDEFQEHVTTNLTSGEMISLAGIATEINEPSIRKLSVHDDPSQCGGFLYTPDRELFGGAFVLVPAGDSFESIHQTVHLYSQFPEFFGNEIGASPRIQVLNGTKRPYFAAVTKVLLQRHCMQVTRFGNGRAQNIPLTTYYPKTDRGKTFIKILQQFIPGTVSDVIPPEYLTPSYISDADVIVELGQDATEHPWNDPFDQIIELKKNEEAEVEETAAPKEN